MTGYACVGAAGGGGGIQGAWCELEDLVLQCQVEEGARGSGPDDEWCA